MTQLQLLDLPVLCGHVAPGSQSHDRVGEYRLVCVRRPHDEMVAHDYIWDTHSRATESVRVVGGLL